MATLNTNAYRNNTRVFYATQGVAIGNIGAGIVSNSWKTSDASAPASGRLLVMHGMQSIGINSNFNLEQLFELGQLSLYVNQEDVPNIEISTERLLDGYTMTYHAATQAAINATLVARADTRTDVRMVISKSNLTAIDSGIFAASELYCSGSYVSSIGISLPTDGAFRENVGFVSNNKKWIADSGNTEALLLTTAALTISSLSGIFGNDSPNTSTSNALRRQNVVTGSTGMAHAGTTYRTVLPTFITNVTAGNAVNSRAATNAGPFITDAIGGTHIQAIEFSCDLNREAINQLGTFAPYNRYANFPVEVTTRIDVIAIAGDNITAVETSNANLSNHEIQVVLDDSTVISTGRKNKVTSVTYGGGDAGGGNAAITYNMSTYNDFIILHSGDPVRATVGDSGYWIDYFPG